MGTRSFGAKTRNRKPRRSEPLRVALGSPVQRENLPLPFVHYPSHYGTFFAFSATEGETPVMCECALSGVRNYLAIHEPTESGAYDVDAASSYDDSTVMAPLSSSDFPHVVALMSVAHPGNSLEYLSFRRGLCHRCNMATPTLRYCVEMYGGTFKQYYGWYINQVAYRLGLHPLTFRYLENVCPAELVARIDEFREVCRTADTERQRLMALTYGPDLSVIGPDEMRRLGDMKVGEETELKRRERKVRQLETQLRNHLENIAREEFGFRGVGDGWISESLLYKLVTRIFPDQHVHRHSRPDWLGGMELDIFIPGLHLAFEYQGQQHFHPIGAWGGEEALRELQKRDVRKAVLCQEHGVRLITLDYTEPLTEDHVRGRFQYSQDGNEIGDRAREPGPSEEQLQGPGLPANAQSPGAMYDPVARNHGGRSAGGQRQDMKPDSISLSYLQDTRDLRHTEEVSPNEWDACLSRLCQRVYEARMRAGSSAFEYKDLCFLGAIFTDAMIAGLSRSQSGWFAPFVRMDTNQAAVGTHADKLLGATGYELIRFGVDLDSERGYHFFLHLEVPPSVFSRLAWGKDSFWVDFVPLFAQGQCHFSIWTALPQGFKARPRGPHGLLGLMDAIVGSCLDKQSQMGGTLEITWSRDLSWPDLIQRLGNCLRCAGYLYSLYTRHESVRGSKLRRRKPPASES